LRLSLDAAAHGCQGAFSEFLGVYLDEWPEIVHKRTLSRLGVVSWGGQPMTSTIMVQGAPGANLPASAPRLLDELRRTAQQRGHPARTVEALADWSLRFIRFHGRRHPREMGLTEVGQFLESVAQTEKEPVRALAAARDALDFLYRATLHIDLGELPLPPPPRLLDQMRQVLRVRHYALRTEEC
jgi:hypothetical protein